MINYTREDPRTMDPTPLRAMIRERAHHTVEIQLYSALWKGKRLAPGTGDKVRQLLAIWRDRGLPTDGPDFAWINCLLEMADRAIKGEVVDLSPYAWQPLDAPEQAVAWRLIQERRSVRHWKDDEVPDALVDQILQAGLWAAHGCNLCSLRFLVVREKNAPGLFVGSDIPGGPLHIVACQDIRTYYVQPGYVANPHTLETNRVLDCGAAMQNMVLMAHVLGLGACWLTFRDEMRDRLRQRFALPDHIEIVTYLDVGYPDQTPMPPGRMALEDQVLARL